MKLSVPTHPPSIERPAEQSAVDTATQILQRRAPRTAVLDRLAMSVGVALLIWGTRPERRAAPDVSGYRVAGKSPDARRAVDRTLAAHGLSYHPFAR